MARIFNCKYFFLFSCAAAALAAAPDYVAEGNRWWSHIQVLADDKMEGRNTGSEGHRKAAQYVAGEFERDGLQAAGTSGYLQPVKFNVSQIAEDQSSLAIVRKGQMTALKLGEDATIGVRTGLAPQVDAAAVFVGHGLESPDNQLH